MSILPTPVLPELSAAEPRPVTGGSPFSKSGTADNITATSFPAVLAQANQQSPTSKAPPSGKDQSGNPTSPIIPQGEPEGEVPSGSDGIESLPAILTFPLLTQPSGLEGTPLSSQNSLVLALTSNVPGESTTGISSQNVLSPVASILGEDETGTVETPRGSALLSSTRVVKGALPNEVDLVATQVSLHTSRSVVGHIPQGVPLPTAVDQDVPPPALTREPLGRVQPGSPLPLPNVPLSFVNGAFRQGQVFGEPVNPSNLSTTVPQNIQGILAPSSGTLSTTGNESAGHGTLSVLGKGEGETGGSSLGFDQRGQQENGAAFSHKQHASGHTLGGHAVVTETGSEFRVSESQSAVRPDTVVDRWRAMNLLSPQRLQLEIMLADQAKVQVDVLVKHQQVSAQLMTDQLMLRNLLLQHQPQLDAQLSSVGLELKQFGAEVGEQGLFGQHLSDSSDQHSTKNSNGSEVDDASVLQASDVLVGAGVEADGRFHFVA
ncbi:MAG: hypothetical protein IH978_00110 [Nitrospinae bacterium]|nr:hypothetical protein [Nitrospinota bacterium]